MDRREGTPDIRRLPPRSIPAGARGRRTPRKTEPRWAIRVRDTTEAHAARAGTVLKRHIYWPEATDGLFPAAQDALSVLATNDLVHHQIAHIRSSQAFALNLFAPLDPKALVTMCAALGIEAASVEPPVFEWSDPADRLAEATKASPHTTQVDVVLRARAAEGTTHVVLIEVKLTEPDFNWCSAWLSPNNDSLDVCRGSGPFGGNAGRCFQLRNQDREHRRQYDTRLGPLPATASEDVAPTSGCWFRHANQPMRNVALARVVAETIDVSAVTVALCAPKNHAAIWRRWAEARRQFSGLDGVTLADLPAELVAAHHPNREELTARYLLDATPGVAAAP